jgi:hydroxymethylpyrimidine pyrophosphatase-like HAD family hydrolase
MVFVFDIDKTLFDSVYCREEDTYTDIQYNFEVIKRVNELYRRGHLIILQTGRHWDKCELTIQQLKEGGILYTTLVMGNIPADFYINDKNLSPNGFIKYFETILKIGE